MRPGSDKPMWDNSNIYIYNIYIYVCVCVCVCENFFITPN